MHRVLIKEEGRLLALLQSYASSIKELWLIGGDFNAIVDYNERVRGFMVTVSDINPLSKCFFFTVSFYILKLLVHFSLGTTNTNILQKFVVGWIGFFVMIIGF